MSVERKHFGRISTRVPFTCIADSFYLSLYFVIVRKHVHTKCILLTKDLIYCEQMAQKSLWFLLLLSALLLFLNFLVWLYRDNSFPFFQILTLFRMRRRSRIHNNVCFRRQRHDNDKNDTKKTLRRLFFIS